MRRVLIRVVVLVVPKKSRTFSSLPCSADEQVCQSWEGAEPDSETKLANGKSLYQRCHAQVVKAGFAGGRDPVFFQILLSLSCGGSNFSGRLVIFPEFGKLCGFCEFGEIGEICELGETHGFCCCCSGTDCESVIGQ